MTIILNDVGLNCRMCKPYSNKRYAINHVIDKLILRRHQNKTNYDVLTINNLCDFFYSFVKYSFRYCNNTKFSGIPTVQSIGGQTLEQNTLKWLGKWRFGLGLGQVWWNKAFWSSFWYFWMTLRDNGHPGVRLLAFDLSNIIVFIGNSVKNDVFWIKNGRFRAQSCSRIAFWLKMTPLLLIFWYISM